jgi:DNA topoisomerase-1
MPTLIITEKPIACQKIVRAISDNAKRKLVRGVTIYAFKLGKDKYYAVPAVGHLFNLKHKKGAKLPIFDVEWAPSYELREDAYYTKKYYDAFQSLKDKVDKFIVATDFDTEGSVIAYTILKQLFNKSDAQRMKFSTLTKEDLEHAFKHRNKHLNRGMINAGELRHMIDYYWGVNSSRALMKSIKKAGRFKILSIGRVQGPMLKVLHDREIEIEKFKPEPYWEVSITFEGVKALHQEKLWDKKKADSVYKAAKKGEAVITKVSLREHLQNPGAPFNLTLLQTEAYQHLGLLPSKTLQTAQKLYEHGLISYPRTSSQKLPPTIKYKRLIKKIGQQSKYDVLCSKLLEKELKPVEGKKTDPAHPAIYPTGDKHALRGRELKLYDLIVKRFLGAFSEPAQKESTTYVLNSAGIEFVAHGRRTLEKGWLAYYDYALEDDFELPKHEEGDKVKTSKPKKHSKKTQPPGRYSQVAIIKLMDKEGIGTKATRSEILKTLYDRGYITGKSITVTELGKTVTEIFSKYSPAILSQNLTSEVEKQMDLVEQGKLRKEKVLGHSKRALKSIITDFDKHDSSIGKELVHAIKDDSHLGKCAKCGGNLVIIRSRRTGKRFVGCDSYPKCTNSYPLPQSGKVENLHKACDKCGRPMIKLIRKRKKPWELCVNPSCPTKDYLKKKKK